MTHNNTYMNMFKAENSNVSFEISLTISLEDPTRSEHLNEDVIYKNSFQSIKSNKNIITAACLHSMTIGAEFGKYVRNDFIIRCRQSTTNPAEIKRYCNLLNWLEQPFILDPPKNHMHQGSDKFMMAIYMHNQIVFYANVFFPYKLKIFGILCYGKRSLMKFIPRVHNINDVPYGETDTIVRQ